MRNFLLLLAALALLGATPALAAKGDEYFGFQLGGSVPSGDLTQRFETGFEGGVMVTNMGSEHAGIGVDLTYHRWEGTDEANAVVVAFLGPDAGYRFDAFQASGHVLYELAPEAKVRPFAKVGVGIYAFKTTYHGPRNNPATGSSYVEGSSRRQFDQSYNAGAGVNFPVSSMHDIGVCAMYSIIDPGEHPAHLFTVAMNLLIRPRAHQ